MFVIFCTSISIGIIIIVYAAEIAFLRIPTILWGVVNIVIWMILFCIIPIPLYMIYGFLIEERLEKIDKIISNYFKEENSNV